MIYLFVLKGLYFLKELYIYLVFNGQNMSKNFVIFLDFNSVNTFTLTVQGPCLREGWSQPDNNKHRSKYGLLHSALIKTNQQAIRDHNLVVYTIRTGKPTI